MKLIDDWALVLKKSWSLYSIYIGMVFISLDGLFAIIGVEWLPFDGAARRVFVLLILLAATYFRVVPQKNIKK